MTVISGERVPFATIVIFCAAALLLIDFKKIIKAIIFFVITAVISIVFIANPHVFERHYNQTVNQVDFQFKKKNFFSNFYYYAETYNTAFAGFLDKKIIGQGPKSFRLFCSDPKFSHYQKREINVSLKDLGLEKVLIDKVFIKNNDSIKKGDILIWHSALVHGGSLINDPNQTRKSFVCHYSTEQGLPFHRAAPHDKPKKFTLNNASLYEDPRIPDQENILSERGNSYKD
jgi:hypothetical protein